MIRDEQAEEGRVLTASAEEWGLSQFSTAFLLLCDSFCAAACWFPGSIVFYSPLDEGSQSVEHLKIPDGMSLIEELSSWEL